MIVYDDQSTQSIVALSQGMGCETFGSLAISLASCLAVIDDGLDGVGIDDMMGSRHCIGALYLGSGWGKARGLWKGIGIGAKGRLGWLESKIATESTVLYHGRGFS